jgi:hypothetical protein
VRQVTPPPAPPDPAIVQRFATAPAPAEGKASVRGFVSRDGYLLGNVTVTARSDQGELETTTGPHGEYTFEDIAPGNWTLELNADLYDPHRYSRRPQDSVPAIPIPATIVLSPGENRRYDLDIASPPPPVNEPDHGPCCKPYGAPPARRRIV